MAGPDDAMIRAIAEQVRAVAERLDLSGVVTIVVLGLTAARRNSGASRTAVRIMSFATWETVTLVLNVLAFTMIGLQLRPVLEGLDAAERATYPLYGVAILAVVIAVRLVWVLCYGVARRLGPPTGDPILNTWRGTLKSGLLVGWSGMRGIVTVAAALAIPQGFPYRDFILLVAFIVVLGTLVLHGLTLKPLLRALRFPPDTAIADEIAMARQAAMRAGLAVLEGDASPAAERVRAAYHGELVLAARGDDPHLSPDNVLRLRTLPESRRAIDELRSRDTIGDEAYRTVEAELDWQELNARPAADG